MAFSAMVVAKQLVQPVATTILRKNFELNKKNELKMC